MGEGFVIMRMVMTGSWSNRKGMGVLVMGIVGMHVGMIHGLMGMDAYSGPSWAVILNDRGR